MKPNGLCKWSAGLKVMHFQFCTEPIRLFNISNFPSIVKDELAVLQRRTAVGLPTETRITFTFCYLLALNSFALSSIISNSVKSKPIGIPSNLGTMLFSSLIITNGE